MQKNGSAKRRNHTKSWLENLESRVLLSTIYVDAGAVGAPDGTSWATAYPDLQQALTAALANDRIQVAGGVYKPTAGADRDVSFELKDDVVIAGGYAGSANVEDPDLRDPTTYTTILSGDIGVADESDDNSHHVVKALGVGGTAELDGVVIADGMADVETADRQFGGGLYVSASTLTVRDSVFLNNTAVTMGGGVYLISGSDVTFVGNTFDDNAAGIGGGVAIDGTSTASFTGDVFEPNGASIHGGAVAILAGSEATLTGVTMTGNVAVGPGGAIHNDGGALTVRDSRFHANRAGTAGGAVYDKDSVGTSIINSTFVGNTAVLGAGVYVLDTAGPAVSIVNSTFNANAASQGGAVYNNSVVVPTVANSILWGNGAGGEVFNAIPGSDAVATYSAVQGGYTGTGNVSVDPLFRRGASAGTDGLWATTDDDYGDLRVSMTSPAVDAGNNAAVPGGVTADLAGNARFLDISSVADTGAGAAPIVDMGALETLDFPTVSFELGSQATDEDGTVTVVVELEGVRDYPVTIPFTLTGTASGTDYTASASPLVIPAGQTTGSITLQITPDIVYELNETIIVTLGTLVSGKPGAVTAHTVTINDTDHPVLDAIANQTVQRGLPLTFTATATDPAAPGTSLTYSLAAGAPAGASIDAGTGVFTWTPAVDLEPGVYSVTVRVAKTADGDLFDEQVVNLTVTDQPVVTLTTTTQSADEGTAVTITVQLSSASDQDVSVPFVVTGTASGTDYTASASPLVILAGETSGTITLQITQDDLPEADETVIVTLGEPVNGTLGTPAVHTVTITDTDAPVLNPIGGQTVQAGQPLAFGATVAAAATPIAFSLVGNVPAGASITADGQFTWTPAAELPAGVYTVTIRVAKTADAASFTEQTVNVTVTAVPDPVVLGSVTGTLFNDLSGEGKRAANEPGLANRSVFLDFNFNGVLDTGELVTTTDAAGNYVFADLPVGLYSVRPIAPAGWRASGKGVTYATVVGQAPAAAAPLSITTRQSIRGVIFNDRNGNKRQNAGEKGLFNFRVYIDLNRNGQRDKGEPVAKSARSGAFAFSTLKLKAGKYILRMIPNAKYSTVSPKAATFPVTLKSGTSLLNRNFALKAIPKAKR